MPDKPKILIVDDNINNIYVIEELLADLDVELIHALSGPEAILQTSNTEFALALIDVSMPGMDGFETVEIIRSRKENEHLNIIYITAIFDEPYFHLRGIKTGAVDFITKPLIPDIFIGKVNIFVKMYKHRKELEMEIQRRIAIEEELTNARKSAEAAALAKQQFLSNMSHEIRTPLNAIINSTYHLLNESPRQDQFENLEILKFSSKNLLKLINEVLDYSKIDSGKIELETIDFELRKLIRGINRSLEYDLIRKGIEMIVTVDNSIPRIITGDSVRLSQILMNLLGNAIKFTDKGKIALEVVVKEDKTGELTLQFSVTDTGIGIPEDKQKEIFESFTQASSSTTRKYGGTGLGLAITKKLVELQGGSIGIDGTYKDGSRFLFTIKYKKSDNEIIVPRAEKTIAFHSLKGISVLIVEDNVINQRIVSKILTKWDATPDIAENGLIALQMVQQKQYNLILMDLQMPEMNGYEATRNIRNFNGEYYKTLPIIALTASAFAEDRDKILSYGMNGYIIKPFTPPELYSKITDFLR
jgi:signal transduction histidine kinase